MKSVHDPSAVDGPATSMRDPVFAILLWTLALAAVSLFAFGIGRFFFGGEFSTTVDSDDAAAILLAREVLRTWSLLPPGWYVANNEIWTLAPHLIALPFVAALGVSASTLALANAAGIVLIALVVTGFVSRMTRSVAFGLIVATGIFAMFSDWAHYMVYAQLAYGFISALLAALAALSIAMLRAGSTADRTGRLSLALYGVVLLLFAFGSPMRAVVYWVVPFVLATLIGARDWNRAVAYRAIVVTIVIVVASAVLHAVAVAGHAKGPAAALLGTRAEWRDSIRHLFDGATALLGPLPAAGNGALAIASSVVRWGFIFAAIILLPLSVVASWRSGTPGNRWFVRFVVFGVPVVFAATFAHGALASGFGTRYLVPHMLLGLVACMTTLWQALARAPRRRLLMSALFIVGFGGSGLAMTKPPAGAPTSCGTPERICSLVDALRGHDLRRGFATFWNANIGMLAAHDDVTIGSISFPPAIHPLRWLASERSFAPVAKGERFFVAIAKKDRATIDEARLSSDLGQPAEIVHAADFEIRVYVADQRNTAWLSREGF